MKNRSVIAVDADADANLASALGIPADEPITPLADMSDMIAERTGSLAAAGEGHEYANYFRLNPKVDDIPERYCRKVGNIRLLVLGGMNRGGGGCLCPASALLKALLIHLTLGRDDALVMDMEAGIEHLGRATAQSMDALIVVVDPTPWSVQTALRVRKLAGDIGLRNVLAVANRTDARGAGLALRAHDVIADRLQGIPLIGQLPTDDRLQMGVLRPGTDGSFMASDALVEHLAAVDGMLSEIDSRTSRH